MSAQTQTTTAIAERPKCDKCGVYLEIRGANGGGATPEQKFCGVWYDHPPMQQGSITFGHTDSVLYPSKALREQLAAA